MTLGNVVSRRYRLVRLLGEGGMGTVFEVEDLELRRSCALKVLQAQLLHNPLAHQRFMREAEFAAGLDHEHVVRVFDRGELADGVPFYTMELLRGRSLAHVAEAEPSLPWRRARHIAMQLCRVLTLVHEQKIVHRDLKPDNCFLVSFSGDHDFLKLLDFGLARADRGDPRLTTTTDQVGGTAMYMSPQHARGEEVDHRTDVWAVGVILYELLAGFKPFERTNYYQIIEAIKIDEPPEPSYYNPQLPPEVDALVAKAMHKELALRYQSAAELLAALEAIPADTVAVERPAAEPRSPSPRVHTPTALAMTQAADLANTQATKLATRVTRPAEPRTAVPAIATTPSIGQAPVPTVSMPPATSAPEIVPVPATPTPTALVSAQHRRRRLVVALGGLCVVGVVLTVVVATWAPPSPAEPVADASVEPTPPPPDEVRGPIEAIPDQKPPSVEVAFIEPPTKVEPERKATEKKKPAAKIGPLSEAELTAKVAHWKAGFTKSPDEACRKITYSVPFKFTTQVGKKGLELVGDAPPGLTLCTNELKRSFAKAFAGKAVQPGVRILVELKIGMK